MIKLLLLSVLFICLPSIICSQNHKDRINVPFPTLQQQYTHQQFSGEQMLLKEFQCILENRFLKKNNKNNELRSVIYRPVKVITDDTVRIIYTYDNSGHNLIELHENWTNNVWAIHSKHTYTYDNSGNRLTGLEETWFNNAWVNSVKYTNTYDGSNNRLTWLEEDWLNNSWQNSYRCTYNYDNSGNMISYISEVWSNNTWVNSHQKTYVYDNSGNLINDLLKVWLINAWENSNNYSYTYDDNGNCIHDESLIWQNSAWVKTNGNLQLWFNQSQDYLYFSAAVVDAEYTSITGIDSDQLNIPSFSLQQNYPNPFNPTTTINYSLAKEEHVKLTVYNAIGSKVVTIVDEYRPAGNYSVQFNGSNLATGIDLCRLETENYSAAKKLILLK